MRVCKKCQGIKPEKEFYFNKKYNYFRPQCNVCLNNEKKEGRRRNLEAFNEKRRRYYKENRERILEKDRIQREANPQKGLDTILRRAYGISLNEYNELHFEQQARCVTCGEPETAVHYRNGRVKRLHVDHDHKTGEIRGLLCARCNLAIGALNDDWRLAEAIAAYLKVFRS